MHEAQQLLLPTTPREEDLGEGCMLSLFDALSMEASERAAAELTATLPWVQEVYYRGRGGRPVPAPRLSSFHGDPGCSYAYSGVRYAPAPWTPTLSTLRARVEQLCGRGFNSVLCNLYRDGRDAMGYHADDEPELGPRPDDVWIASLSLGAPRRFALKHRRSGTRRVYTLGEGRLLLMRGRTQQRWVHALPRTARPVGPRLNLTFRVINA